MNGKSVLVAAVALVVVCGATLVPQQVGLLALGAPAALLIGVVAAYWTASSAETNQVSRGIRIGLLAAAGAWIGTAIAITVSHLGVIVISDQFAEAFTTRISLLAGLVLGVVNFGVAGAGGVIGAILGARRPGGSRAAAR